MRGISRNDTGVARFPDSKSTGHPNDEGGERSYGGGKQRQFREGRAMVGEGGVCLCAPQIRNRPHAVLDDKHEKLRSGH